MIPRFKLCHETLVYVGLPGSLLKLDSDDVNQIKNLVHGMGGKLNQKF